MTKYERLRKDCFHAISEDKIDLCFQLLAESLDDSQEAFDEYIQLKRRYKQAVKNDRMGIISNNDTDLSINNIVKNLTDFVRSLEEDDVSLFQRVLATILIFKCPDSTIKWDRLFPEAFFSNTKILAYGNEIPVLKFSPDILIFEGLDNACLEKHLEDIVLLSERFPKANILYLGYINPFGTRGLKEDPAVFARCNNANSIITIHGRLREILEYRKIYGESD